MKNSVGVGRIPSLWFNGAVIAAGLPILVAGLWEWRSPLVSFSGFCLLMAAVCASVHRSGRLAGCPLVASLAFVVSAATMAGRAEAVVIGAVAALSYSAGYGWKHAEFRLWPVLFRIGSIVVAIEIGWQVYQGGGALLAEMPALRLLVLACVIYGVNAIPVVARESLARRVRFSVCWRDYSRRTFPLALLGGVLALVLQYSARAAGETAPLLLVPAAQLAYLGWQWWRARRVGALPHEVMSALQRRTIEALAMAIEAKDLTAHTHVHRLQVYCVEIAREMGLPQGELEAVRAAAVLHDIGKLAVPEHILAKAGPLTREEFERVKIHPVVGAEILERVSFPYPVAPIVRSHHEKWNGCGYPRGLRGEQIPLGARILAVVDAFDCMISDRPYRRAMSRQEALHVLSTESGISFDPRVVEVLLRRHQELEEEMLRKLAPLPADPGGELAEVDLGDLSSLQAMVNGARDIHTPGFYESIAAARLEAQLFFELTHELGASLQLNETLPMLSDRLKRIIPCDSMAIYITQGEKMSILFATGDCAHRLYARNPVPAGGLVGAVAAQNRAVLNGLPAAEYGDEQGLRCPMQSALAVPLEGAQGTVGVLMLCRREAQAFHRDHARILGAVSGKLGVVLENALAYQKATASATTDFLTGLPNAAALHTQLDSELARAQRLGGGIAVVVSDLDGFKQVNDRFGHLKGNDVLREVARALRESCREYDFVARMGGDEFVLLLPGISKEDIPAKTSSLNRAVMRASSAACPEAPVSLSIGLASFPEDGRDAATLLAIADQRMYDAKMKSKLRSHRDGPRGFDFDWIESAAG